MWCHSIVFTGDSWMSAFAIGPHPFHLLVAAMVVAFAVAVEVVVMVLFVVIFSRR